MELCLSKFPCRAAARRSAQMFAVRREPMIQIAPFSPAHTEGVVSVILPIQQSEFEIPITLEALSKKIEALKASCPDYIFSKDYAVSNDPAEAILDKQSKGAYELVVMGSHGRKGFGRILMGSVSESVLREANCPVLIIKKVAEKK